MTSDIKALLPKLLSYREKNTSLGIYVGKQWTRYTEDKKIHEYIFEKDHSLTVSIDVHRSDGRWEFKKSPRGVLLENETIETVLIEFILTTEDYLISRIVGTEDDLIIFYNRASLPNGDILPSLKMLLKRARRITKSDVIESNTDSPVNLLGLVTLRAVRESDVNRFILFWKKQYNYPKEHLYRNSIGLTEFGEQNLLDLYQWKNGMTLSGNKLKSLNSKIVSKVTIINLLKKTFAESTFQDTFKDVSPIWKIFLRHIIQPENHPIFDQHVYRAYKYMSIGIIAEVPSNAEEVYHLEYCPFFDAVKASCNCKPKEIDEALFAYGKFLSTYPSIVR